LGCLASLVAASAHAQPHAGASAEALFQQGRALLARGETSQACLKFEESLRMEPGSGTLLALAICHEQEGKTATAWAEFLQAASRAKADGRGDRAEAATSRANALQPRLSFLTLDVVPSVAAIDQLAIRVDGRVIGPAAYGAPLPMDPGAHEICAEAPGYEKFVNTTTIAADAATVVVAIPALVAARGTAPALGSASAPDAPPVSSANPDSRATDRDLASSGPSPDRPRAGSASSQSQSRPLTIPILTAGLGLVAVGVGSYFGLQGLSAMASAREMCPADKPCVSFAATEKSRDANDAANVANVAFAVGATALVSAAIVYFASGQPEPAQARSRSGPVVAIGPNTSGMVGWAQRW